MKKLCALLCIKFFPQQDDTKIVNFDEGVLILWPFFWGNVIFKICPSISKVTIYVPKLSIVWLPRVKRLLLLCKAEPTWIKRSIHDIILQHYNPGELLKEIPPYLKHDFWCKRSEFWKWHWLRKIALESKRLHQNHSSWCHFAGKRMFYSSLHSLIWLSPWFLWNWWSKVLHSFWATLY